MKIFLLEDNGFRIKKFKQACIGHVLHTTEYVTEAKMFLKDNDYDLIFLDHDLGGQTYVASGTETGFEIARFLTDNRNKEVPTVIHSCNPSGALNMKNVLPHAKLIPYVSLNIEEVLKSAAYLKAATDLKG